MWIYDDYIIKPRRMKKEKTQHNFRQRFFFWSIIKKGSNTFWQDGKYQKTHPFYFNLKLCFFLLSFSSFPYQVELQKFKNYSVLLVIQKLHFCFIRSQTTHFCFQWEFEGKKVKTLFLFSMVNKIWDKTKEFLAFW